MARETAEAAISETQERAFFAPDGFPVPAAPTTTRPEPAALETAATAHAQGGGRLDVVPSAMSSVWRIVPALKTDLVLEEERGTFFLFIPVFLAVGVIAYFTAVGEPEFYALWSSVLALAALALVAGGQPILRLALTIALIVLLGVLAAKLEVWRTGTKIIGSDITTRVMGHVVLVEPQPSGRVRLTIDVAATERPTLRYAPDRIRVTARAMPEGLQAGSAVAGVVRLLPPTGPVRPGSYDFSFQSYFSGIGASGFFLIGPELDVRALKQAGWRTNALTFVENTRKGLAARIADGIGGVEGQIAAALVVGVRSGIPEPVNEAMRRTGLAHILSISGLHMALVAATVMGLLRGIFALFPGFASRYPVKKFAAGAALVAISAYLFVSGAAVAAERSYIMLAVMLTALLFDRAALTMRNLAIAALFVVARSPHEVMGPSFQMSFAATAALIGGYAAWSGRQRTPTHSAIDTAHLPLPYRMARKALFYAGGLALTSLIAGTATTLFGIYHFQRISPLSLAANLAAMPVVSAIVMPSAVIGMVAMPFGLDGYVFAVMGKGLSAMLAIANWFSERSPIDAVGLIPAGSVAVMTVALVLATLSSTRLRLTALPFLAVGLFMASSRQLPDVLISEDARLVGVRLGDGELAVNRNRPSAFAMENWQRALDTPDITRPRNEPYQALGNEVPGAIPFLCDAGVCMSRHGSGAVIAHAADAKAARGACAIASIIVIDDATAKNICPGQPVEIITKRDLAAHGSAAILLSATDPPVVTFAIGNHYRPWHTQRRFSREARGNPPYQRKMRSKPEGEAENAEAD
ncbi:DUF4131 domain-containing protein [Mesorhizobium sp. NBSH29]|uniref:ComEC/Rec2 family competence protein n=1 Tax=Mesorhizobium sp. NBSH29 TaxID=2654249 RepID=UPI0018966351|nr:ComEC/Rec2 family competence protein [Mesorhizobium sp. NBSH29]QPC87783.1 DUF4131 domain-containing protein [Mesorhizobium sp. NBSH29]